MKSELPEPPEHPKSIVFLGTPEAAVLVYEKFVGYGFESGSLCPTGVEAEDQRRRVQR